MAKRGVTTLFKSLLLQFIGEEDPLLSMLQWTMQQLMQVEAENKVGAEKGKHAPERRTNFSGYRWRRFDTRLAPRTCSFRSSVTVATSRSLSWSVSEASRRRAIGT